MGDDFSASTQAEMPEHLQTLIAKIHSMPSANHQQSERKARALKLIECVHSNEGFRAVRDGTGYCGQQVRDCSACKDSRHHNGIGVDNNPTKCPDYDTLMASYRIERDLAEYSRLQMIS